MSIFFSLLSRIRFYKIFCVSFHTSLKLTACTGRRQALAFVATNVWLAFPPAVQRTRPLTCPRVKPRRLVTLYPSDTFPHPLSKWVSSIPWFPSSCPRGKERSAANKSRLPSCGMRKSEGLSATMKKEVCRIPIDACYQRSASERTLSNLPSTLHCMDLCSHLIRSLQSSVFGLHCSRFACTGLLTCAFVASVDTCGYIYLYIYFCCVSGLLCVALEQWGYCPNWKASLWFRA